MAEQYLNGCPSRSSALLCLGEIAPLDDKKRVFPHVQYVKEYPPTDLIV